MGGPFNGKKEQCGHRGDSYRTAMQYASLPEAQLTLTTLFKITAIPIYRLENKLHKGPTHNEWHVFLCM